MTAQVLEATPSLDGQGNISWTLCDKVSNQCGNATGNYPTVTLPAKSGTTAFSITINDANHLGVTFANNSSDPYASSDGNGAIWIQPNSCPGHAAWNTSGQIPKVTRANDTKITFNDANGQNGALTLAYQLNFVRNGTAVTPIDPIISNGGCCNTIGSGRDTIWYALGIVAIIAVIVLIARMMKKSTT